jgi:hypothetical protein
MFIVINACNNNMRYESMYEIVLESWPAVVKTGFIPLDSTYGNTSIVQR